MPPPSKTYSTDWKSKKATDNAVAALRASFEKTMGTPLQVGRRVEPYRVIPTGSLVLDAALGVGGLAVGRVHEYHGPEHAGKSTLAVLAAREAQRTQPDKMVGWLDMEQTFDVGWAVANGLDMDRVLFFTPKTAEDTADAAKQLIESGLCSLVVLDSVGGMIARIQLEKNADEATVAAVARIVTTMVKTAAPMCASNQTTLLVINQVRSNIAKYGPDTTTPGGWALKHITTCRLKVSRGGSDPLKVRVEGKEVPVGYEISVKVEKNKVSAYGNVASIWLRNRATDRHGPIGVDLAAEAFTVGKRFGLVKQEGGGYYVAPDGERLKGENALLKYLRDHPDLIERVRADAIAEMASAVAEEPDDGSNPDDPMGIAEMM